MDKTKNVVKEQKYKQLLDRLFKNFQSPAAFTSAEPLFHEARRYEPNITRLEVQAYLNSQPVYTLHRRVVRKYRHMPTLAPGLNTEWQCDLADFRRLVRKNRGYHYLLVCIDTLSRKIFVEPVRSKHSDDMLNAFERLFSHAGVLPWKLLSDAGLEFRAARVQKFLRDKEVEHFCMQTSPRFHAGMAERANRSIKERLYRYFTENKTQRWVDVIQQIVSAINHSYNSSICMRPVDVTYENAETLRRMLKQNALFEQQRASRWRRPARFALGDRVRVEKHKHVFQKGYTPNFTAELFTIDRVRKAPHQPPTYRIRDAEGELVPGWFYTNDLCAVAEEKAASDKQLYDIERIIDEQNREGNRYVLVKWKGYGPEHNSWIAANSIVSK